MAYNKLLGVDTLWVQVGLQHLSFRFRGRPIMFFKTIISVAAVAYQVLDQWRLFYKLYPIFMHFLLINACSSCKCHQCLSILWKFLCLRVLKWEKKASNLSNKWDKKGSKDFQICPRVTGIGLNFPQVANCFTDQKSSVTAQLRCIYSAMAMCLLFLPINLLICWCKSGNEHSLPHIANLFLAI